MMNFCYRKEYCLLVQVVSDVSIGCAMFDQIPHGVWKDVDVLRSETVQGSSSSYTMYVIEVTASDGTSWQVGNRLRRSVSISCKFHYIL